ncbi:hypothetical protein CR513_29091, partial [Mucuna pruriens]
MKPSPRDETPTKEAIVDVANKRPGICSFPQRMKNEKKDKEFTKFLEIFSKLHINISFIEVITKIPNYAKNLKNIISNKKKLEEFELVTLIEEYSALVLNKFI